MKKLYLIIILAALTYCASAQTGIIGVEINRELANDAIAAPIPPLPPTPISEDDGVLLPTIIQVPNWILTPAGNLIFVRPGFNQVPNLTNFPVDLPPSDGPFNPLPIVSPGIIYVSTNTSPHFPRVHLVGNPGVNIFSRDIVDQVRHMRFPQKLAPVPVSPVRSGIVGFVDNFNSKSVSMLTIISERRGGAFGAITDHQGFFQINLTPGKYVIAVLNGTDHATVDAVEAEVHPGNFSFVKLTTISNFRAPVNTRQALGF